MERNALTKLSLCCRMIRQRSLDSPLERCTKTFVIVQIIQGVLSKLRPIDLSKMPDPRTLREFWSHRVWWWLWEPRYGRGHGILALIPFLLLGLLQAVSLSPEFSTAVRALTEIQKTQSEMTTFASRWEKESATRQARLDGALKAIQEVIQQNVHTLQNSIQDTLDSNTLEVRSNLEHLLRLQHALLTPQQVQAVEVAEAVQELKARMRQLETTHAPSP